jgi:hypothetical protein
MYRMPHVDRGCQACKEGDVRECCKHLYAVDSLPEDIVGVEHDEVEVGEEQDIELPLVA